ncbi:hypothetical protein U879_03875 [Defluviimonas sp. 20V17]|uniref:VOC domain-containing protein n=1 Tax=Allgaiera indica TaxID=765699 RepID=A0AAN4UUJ0_9RHOB|nr:hypothetical protein [Allgaiera indica]KDB04969.1 hypothetical protein U879_03875 [Defluviimonas sp. 20V17]GHE05452.1 hypothetical protein GCM10008024_36250 [Allgaiera indica]SDX71870.1 hypothetical protein SAMN05444006_12620 [Allgaiera indica]
MRWRRINQVEFSVLEYELSVALYDLMFGWLGYKGFWALDIGSRSTYYVERCPFPHSYISIQPAQSGGKLDHAARATGIHHIALWTKSARKVETFHREVLIRDNVPVTEAPAAHFVYAPGYYAVFFNDPISGIHWELAHIPHLPSPPAYLRFQRIMKQEQEQDVHPEWRHPAMQEAMRVLPGRRSAR